MTFDSPQLHCLIHSWLSNEIVDEDRKVRRLITERHPFKRVENYFTDFLFYQDSLETDENSHSEEPDSDNEADTELEEDECLWKINSIVTSIDKLDFDTTTNVEGEWFINENLDLAYFSTFAFDFVPVSYTHLTLPTIYSV